VNGAKMGRGIFVRKEVRRMARAFLHEQRERGEEEEREEGRG